MVDGLDGFGGVPELGVIYFKRFWKMCIFFAYKIQKPIQTHPYPTINIYYQVLINGGVATKRQKSGGVWWGGQAKTMGKGNLRRLVENLGNRP